MFTSNPQKKVTKDNTILLFKVTISCHFYFLYAWYYRH